MTPIKHECNPSPQSNIPSQASSGESDQIPLELKLFVTPHIISPFVYDSPPGSTFHASEMLGLPGCKNMLNELVGDLMRLPSEKQPPCYLASWEKGPTWFEMIMRLHFSGHSVDSLSDEKLGLTGEGEYDQHMVYRAVLGKLREFHGARTPENFKYLMDWLVRIELVRDFSLAKCFAAGAWLVKNHEV